LGSNKYQGVELENEVVKVRGLSPEQLYKLFLNSSETLLLYPFNRTVEARESSIHFKVILLLLRKVSIWVYDCMMVVAVLLSLSAVFGFFFSRNQWLYARCEEVHEVAQYLDGKGNNVSASAS
jgi:hypothetical protein